MPRPEGPGNPGSAHGDGTQNGYLSPENEETRFQFGLHDPRKSNDLSEDRAASGHQWPTLISPEDS